MNMQPDTALMVIEPWQARHYLALQQPYTVAATLRSLQRLDDHRRILETRGDTAAVAGLATPVRLTIIELAGVAATSPRQLARKVAALAAYRWVWAGHTMLARLLETAVIADATALKLGSDTETRLRHRLRGAS